MLRIRTSVIRGLRALIPQPNLRQGCDDPSYSHIAYRVLRPHIAYRK